VAGRLLVVATPLGNLADLSPRALDALRGATRIVCEDTRRTRKLLARYDLATAPLLSCHKFSEHARLAEIRSRLARGETLALVTDGGTPAISDPGAAVVRAALDSGAAVEPVPGPSAVTAALSISGFAGDRFVFDAFLPARSTERRRRLRDLAREERTIVVLEAPHRIVATLSDLLEIFGSRPIVLARELTKVHETVLRGTAAEIALALGPAPKGEVTLVIAGAPLGVRTADDPASRRLREAWTQALAETGGDRRLALRRVARSMGLGRAELQRALVEIGAVERDPR
jgi:16S rRNA (cytidine1402-2'-O)-methyltransferase